MNGILCLDKPADMTSFSCCAVLRRLCQEKKVGHAGTLDPMATGVLPVLVGNATRALDWLPVHDKRYTATLRFGLKSDTLDIWGHVTKTGGPVPTREAILAALPAFRGEIMQTPPMTSALRQNGVRLYELARRGIEVERPARPVTIHTLTLLDFDPSTREATIDCACSKGTYIRSLCDDLGRALGTSAVMTALRRTEAAGFTLDDCLTLDQARALAEEGTLAARLIPTEMLFSGYAAVTVTEKQARRFANGGALELTRLHQPVAGTVRVYAPDRHFLGLGVPADGSLTVGRLFP